MSNILIFSTAGKIIRNVSAPANMLQMQIQTDEFGIENVEANLITDYVVNNSVTARPTQTTTLSKITITADGVDAISIENAPEGIFTAINTSTTDTVTGPINGSDTFSTTIVGSSSIMSV